MIHTPLLGRGGGERQILRLALELQKLGHEVEIFTSAVNEEKCYPNMLRKVTINVIAHPLGRKIPNFLAPVEISQKGSGTKIEEASSLRMWMRRNLGHQFYTIPYDVPSMLNLGRSIPKGFDVINNHNFPSEWATFIAKKRLKAPVVWMCNEPPFWFFVPELRAGLRKINWPVFEVLDKVAVKYIDQIIVLSHVAQGYVRKAYQRRSKVVRSGTDIELFHEASGKSIRAKYALGNDFVLLQVGNLELNKRQADSIVALYYLSKSYNNVKLILDGGGRREDLVKLCEELGVRDKVLFLHTNDDEELAKVYAACDVFVFPAQITWGLAVTEAMAAAKPVIVSKRAGASEIIENNVNGIVVDHAKPEKIAEQVEILMNNPKLRKKLGENAYKYVVRNFSWEKYAKNMENVFQKTISNFRRSS
jgi:glycosyltransferase involved in cell wall biosynthesis